MIHSPPETPLPGDHTRRYMSVVHGATRSPRSGHTHEPNAKSTRFPKSHIAMIAKRGPRAAKRARKQHIGGSPSHNGPVDARGTHDGRSRAIQVARRVEASAGLSVYS